MSVSENPGDSARAREAGASYDDLPLHQFLGVHLVDPQRPELGVEMIAGEHLAGRGPTMHGGVVPLIMDGAAFMALAPHLLPNEDAVSHDLHYSVLRPIPVGAHVTVRGRVIKKGGRVAFLEAQAEADGKLAVTARITKSIIVRSVE